MKEGGFEGFRVELEGVRSTRHRGVGWSLSMRSVRSVKVEDECKGCDIELLVDEIIFVDEIGEVEGGEEMFRI